MADIPIRPGIPTDPSTGKNAQPYDETVFFFHHSKQGIRLDVQGNTKFMIVIILAIAALLNVSGIGDTLRMLVSAILSGH